MTGGNHSYCEAKNKSCFFLKRKKSLAVSRFRLTSKAVGVFWGIFEDYGEKFRFGEPAISEKSISELL